MGGTALPLVLAGAAALSCWNLFGAPFAVIVAAGTLPLALLRARGRTGPARTRLRIAAGLSAASLAVALAVLVSTVRGGGEAPAVTPGSPGAATQEATRALDEAERATATRRDAARHELERSAPPTSAPPDERRAR